MGIFNMVFWGRIFLVVIYFVYFYDFGKVIIFQNNFGWYNVIFFLKYSDNNYIKVSVIFQLFGD